MGVAPAGRDLGSIRKVVAVIGDGGDVAGGDLGSLQSPSSGPNTMPRFRTGFTSTSMPSMKPALASPRCAGDHVDGLAAILQVFDELDG